MYTSSMRALLVIGSLSTIQALAPGTASRTHHVHESTFLLSTASGEGETTAANNWWEPTWTDVEILSNEEACASGRCRSIRVTAPPELRAEYRAPGQYLQVRSQRDEYCFLPIASSPLCRDHFEFLIKDNGNREKAWLLDLPPGTALQLSGSVLGRGFQPRELPTTKPTTSITDLDSVVVMACNGLGLASLKAAIESGRLPRGGRLYYGERTAADLCYADRFADWENQFGFQVIPVLSRPSKQETTTISTSSSKDPGEVPGVAFREGYVQDALRKDGLEGDPDHCYALVCGVMAMMDSVSDFLKEEGVSPTRIMINLEA